MRFWLQFFTLTQLRFGADYRQSAPLHVAALTSTAPSAPKEAPAATVIVQAPATTSEKKHSTPFQCIVVQINRFPTESITDLFQKYKES